MKDFLCGAMVFSVVVGCMCLGAPKPAIVPDPGDWTVDVKFEHPQQIVLWVDGDDGPQRFWYIIITLTNNTNRDVDFYPKCELMTDTLQIVPAGRGVWPKVFEQIKNRHQGRYPFLEPLEKVNNKLLQGEDNTRDIAVIWTDFDTRARKIQLFLAGLSNETVVIDHPIAKDKAGRPVKVFLRKTLELDYHLGGDPQFRSDARLIFKGKQWVMR